MKGKTFTATDVREMLKQRAAIDIKWRLAVATRDIGDCIKEGEAILACVGNSGALYVWIHRLDRIGEVSLANVEFLE